VDVAAKMREVLQTLRTEGFNGVTFPEVRPEAEYSWSPSYAIAERFQYDTQGYDAYFAHDRFRRDLEQFLLEQFGPGARMWDGQNGPPGSTTIRIYWHTHELEVVRV
jgi:hypothetical protein